MKHWRIDIQGRVQGVFYRASARDIAEKLNIKGYVENCPDGSVHIEAEGMAEDLRKFVNWCHEGPPRASVTAVDYREDAIVGYEKFEIRR